MPVRPEVREAQRTIAALDAAHRNAANRLDQVLARRAEVLAEQDRLAATAQAALEQSIAEMANQLSGELAAELVGLELMEVRRITKAHPAAGARSKAGGKQGVKASRQEAPNV